MPLTKILSDGLGTGVGGVDNTSTSNTEGGAATTSVVQGLAKAWFLFDQRGSVLGCLLYTSPSPRDATLSRMPSSA